MDAFGMDALNMAHYQKTNREFWNNKISNNIKRDQEVNHHLTEKGWRVMRFWQHDLKTSDKIIKQLNETGVNR